MERAQATNISFVTRLTCLPRGAFRAALARDARQEVRECMPAVRFDRGLVARCTCVPRVFVCEVPVHGGQYPSALVRGISRIVRM